MIRPWKVVLSVAAGAAVLPSAAMAAPTITINTPQSGAAYAKGAAVTVDFSCSADAVSCVATKEASATVIANGSALDTSTVGNSWITVTARDAAGSQSVAQSAYSITEGGNGGPGGEVPATLHLDLGTPTAFSPFVPGLTKDYFATLNASIISTAGDATLTVNDAATTNVGKLVNGSFALPTAVQAGAAKVPTDGTPTPAPAGYAPLGGASAPTTLLTYDGPVSGSAAITFKQVIAATDALRTGSYSKTLTFTLSTTNP
jgi:hypothetical protein